MDADFGLTLCQNTDAACNARSQYHGGGTAIGKRKTEYIQIAIYGKQIFYMEQTAGKQIFYNIGAVFIQEMTEDYDSRTAYNRTNGIVKDINSNTKEQHIKKGCQYFIG